MTFFSSSVLLDTTFSRLVFFVTLTCPCSSTTKCQFNLFVYNNNNNNCRILFPDKTEWRLISATLCGWRHCFVADQLWFMTCIREEEKVTKYILTQYNNKTVLLYICVCVSCMCLVFRLMDPCGLTSNKMMMNDTILYFMTTTQVNWH